MKYLFSKTWPLIVFAGIMGYIVYIKSAHTLDYLPSRILVTSIWSASLMWGGLVAGSAIGRKKN